MSSKTAAKASTNGHSPSAVLNIPLTSIAVSMLEPQLRRREHFKPDEINELADSIKSMGLISPITVRPWSARPVETSKGTDYEPTYQLVAGERRFLATKAAGLESIDAVVRDLDDQQTIEIQLHENLKRLDVEPLDEAFSYKYLIDHAQILEGGIPRPYTVADIAAKFSRTEEIIIRRLKLLELCGEGKKDLADGYLPLAHAELIARFPEDIQKTLLKDDVYNYSWNDKDKRTAGAKSFKSLRETIENNNTKRVLTSAKFDTADPSLRADGLVCSNCTTRTGYSVQLFSDTKLGQKDVCLNGKCWDGKIRAMLQQKREKIAASLPNPDDLPIKDLALLVPLVKADSWSSGHRNITLGKGVYVDDSYYSSRKTFVLLKSTKECDRAEKALRVGGDNIGASTIICRSTKCKKHKTAETETAGSTRSESMVNDNLKRKEDEFNGKVAEKVRVPILTDYIGRFNSKSTVFDTPELRKQLLIAVLGSCSYEFEDRCGDMISILPKEIEKLLNTYDSQSDRVTKAVEKLTEDEISRAFAFIAFAQLGYSEWDSVDQAPVKAIAEKIGVNYQLADAVARVEVVETEHPDKKPICEAYLEKVVSGKAPAKPPALYWPKPKEEKKSAKKAKEVSK